MLIFVDPGHGGDDPGAVSGTMVEKELNLKVGLALRDFLIRAGHTVIMSRQTDITVSLSKRCRLANEARAALFVSVHHNAGGGTGYEVIHSVHHGTGWQVAGAIGREFDGLGEKGHGLHPIYDKEGSHGDYFAVIRDTNMPAVICEYCFIDSSDRTAVDTDEELLSEAGAIARGIDKGEKTNG